MTGAQDFKGIDLKGYVLEALGHGATSSLPLADFLKRLDELATQAMDPCRCAASVPDRALHVDANNLVVPMCE